MSVINLKDLKAKAEAATPGEWFLDHEDTFIGCRYEGQHDWDWITGDMSSPQTDYEAECLDEHVRGSKEKVQIRNRFIASANPATVLTLLECLERAMGALEDYVEYELVGITARDALAEIRSKVG